MDCHGSGTLAQIKEGQFKILLMGNPNVGKSVIFSKLTGMDVIASNYAGTTVTFTHGEIKYKGEKATLIDVPGTYSLEATSPAEEVAVNFLENENADMIICVLDATNLERNLNFALQLRKYKLPTVFVLNLLDVAERQGTSIDVVALSKALQSPVVPMIAIRNVGIKDLLKESWNIKENLDNTKENNLNTPVLTQDERWIEVGKIISKVQTVEHKHPSFLERLGDATLRPFPGIPIAFFVLIAALGIVVGGGKALRAVIFLPLVNNLYVPAVTSLVSNFISEGMLYNVLVGEYGVLVKSIEWPFALILPYVSLFYIVLSFMEDSGYLPRLGVLVDGVFRKIGIQGGNIVPFIMGYGCAVPAILGSRAATSHKERIIVASLVSLAVPCAAQTGAFISLLGDHSVLLLVAVYGISFLSIVIGGLILDRMLPGKIDPILLEIPNLLLPNRDALLKKIWLRTKHFLIEAEVPMMLGIGFAALVAETGILNSISAYISPVTVGWLGLPEEATIGLLLGIIRRELAVLPMLSMNLSTLQLLVGSVVALFYIPCLSVLGVLIKELGLKIALTIGAMTIILAFLFGGLINQIGNLVSSLI